MFDLSPEKILLVGIIALVVLGPNRLPQAARSFGRFIATLRRMSAQFQQEMHASMDEPTARELKSALGDLRTLDVRRSVRDAITTNLTPDPAPPANGAGPSAAVPAAGVTGTPPFVSPAHTDGHRLPPAPDDPSLN
ncbi:MAG: Sec-independent protein translocase subunit TatA/TatB [Acidimicrobiales bacterium]